MASVNHGEHVQHSMTRILQPQPNMSQQLYAELNVYVFLFSSSSTRQHTYKLHKQRGTSVRADLFACRIVNVWNCLPDSVSFTSISAFKKSIRTVDFSQFLKCQ